MSRASVQHMPEDQEMRVVPISFAQRRFWMQDQVDFHTTLSGALQLHLPLDGTALEQSLAALIQRHEILRTTFQVLDGQPMQVIAPHLQVPLPQEDLRALPPEQQEAAVLQLTSQQAQCPFDIAHGPLLRLTLLRLAPQEHLLLLTLHHLIADGWSLGIFCQELATLYTAFSHGQAATLPQVPRQYADYALWQRQWLQGERLDAALAYWQQQLADAPTTLALPTDYPCPLQPSRRAAHYLCQVPKSLSEALLVLSRQEEVTLYMTLVAAFLTLLYRYSGQEDLLLGTISPGRNRAELEPVLGCFENTLLLRADLSDNPPFRELLQRVRTRTVEALAHQEVPFEAMLQALSPAHQVDQNSLVQVLLTLEPPLPPLPPGWMLTPLAVETGASKFALSLELEDRPEGLVGRFEYHTDLFEAATIAHLAAHWQRLLAAIVQDPEQRVGELPLLTEGERQRLLVEWNDTATAYPEDRRLHQLVEEQVERTPDAVAVIFGEQQLTYRELNARANQLAHHLQRLGVGPEVLVGLCVERSLEMAVGLLGILKAGGAYVPLDPTYPKERLAFMLDDMQATVLLTQARLAATLPEHQAQMICLDSDWERMAHEDITNPLSGVAPANLAYVIYTSGSTGQPKGAMNTHRGICNRLLWMQDAYQLTETDRVLQKTPFTFDVSVWEFFWPLMTGAQLVVARPEGHKDSAYLLSLIVDKQITTLHFVPSMLQVFLDEIGLERCQSLRRVICSGEVLPFELQERYFTRLTAELHNLYGPTEAAIDVTFWACQRESARRTVPIGYPIANTQIYLLDGDGQPVPIGVPGELYIGGVGVARGYLNRPELTAERFIPDPFSQKPGARLYKTGDRARYLSNGAIEYLGRLDHQVKLRGFRIELGEIEAVLNQHPAVGQSVVIAREDGPGDKWLVAYVVPHQQPAPSCSELRTFLQGKLPAYMVPAAFVLLDALPLTSNGKVDRRALPAPDPARSELQETYMAPRTPVEEVLASLFADVLGLKQVGVHDNFFQLGGHSLLATQLVSRVRSTLQVELPLLLFFEAPSVAQLAALLQAPATQARETGRVGGSATPPVRPVSHAEPPPLSFAQQRLWFLDQLVPGSPFYNIHTALRLSSPLDVAVLERSLNEIVRRHEALRTRFVAIDGIPVQLIAPSLTIPLPMLNLRTLPPSEREAEALRLACEEAMQPFDLAHGPLVRICLLQLDEADHVFLLTMHHIVSDAWSKDLFFQELSTLYRAFSKGQPSPLPELPIQYADFAVWQRQWLQGEVLAEQLAYWKRQLADLPVLQLSTDHPYPPVQTFRGTCEFLTLSAALSAALKALSQREGVTLFMTLLAAFQALLARYSGQDDIVVGSYIANRTRVELEGLIGCFVNSLVLRTDLSGNPSFRELLCRVREVALGAYAHQDLPFEKLVEELQPERDLSRNPLFQVTFQLLNAPTVVQQTLDPTQHSLEVKSKTTAFDASFNLWETPEGLRGSFEYNADLFDSATITRLLGHYQTLLAGIVANPEQHVSELPLLTQAERQQLLVDWNSTQAPYPREVCLHQLFEVQVEHTPEAVALVFEAEHLSYRDLNQRANQLAHHLLALGVGPEVLVGICMERSLQMVIGLLGILKAGGAYVPLDPTYPSERLAFMLEDAQVPLLLTQQHLLACLPEHAAHLVCLDRDWDAVAQQSATNPLSGVRAENLAYVIYTSGSTGRPKGVLATHRAAINRFHWMWKTYPFEPEEICCQKTSLSFVDSIWEIFGPLLQGIRTVIIPDIVVKSPQHMLQTLSAHSVTRIVLVPSLLRVLLDTSADIQDQLPRLKYWISSGEALPLELAQRFLDSMPRSTLINLYGSSEVAADVTCYDSRSSKAQTCVPLGRPIANTQIYLLDCHMQLVPIGVPGELYVGGDGLARGYFNRPELTAARFVPNPFSTEPGARLYKTGDWARFLPDGNIEFLGRLDQQVKLRGFRIELGEIEEVLRAHPAIRETVVVTREDTPGDKRLVAYVVLHREQSVTSSELRRFLQAQVPAYMVPSAFVLLDALPLTPNGKVDRHALPTPDAVRPEPEETFVAPTLRVHYQLLEIWEELLDARPIGIRDNFFYLGGHSFLAARLMHHLEQVFGQKIPLATLFAGPTIEHLANALQRQEAADSRSPLMAIQTEGSKRPFFYLHGDWNAGAFYCWNLARDLDPAQPFYVLEPYRFEDLPVPPTFEAMATAHLEAMRTVQPKGPYLLGGFCNGGLIAYEMARQLYTQGESVDLLVLIDPASPAPYRWLRSVINRLGALMHLRPEQQLEWFLRLLHVYKYLRLSQYRRRWIDLERVGIIEQTERGRRGTHAGRVLARFAWVVPTVEAIRRHWLNVYEWVAADYVPGPYPGKLTVFWSSEEFSRVGWHNVLLRVEWSKQVAVQEEEVHVIPGTHMTWMTEPEHLRTLAQHLRTCLNKAHAATWSQ